MSGQRKTHRTNYIRIHTKFLKMKKSSAVLLFIAIISFTVTTLSFFIFGSTQKFASISVPQQIIDVGLIEEGVPAKATFFIVNAGNATLHIDNIETDCSCTTTELINPNISAADSVSFSLIYDSHSLGLFQKRAFIYSNSKGGVMML